MNAVDSLLDARDNPDWDSGTAELGHVLKPGKLDLSHKVILYLEDITVTFDGFRALNCYDPPYSSLFVPSYSGVRQRESPTL